MLGKRRPGLLKGKIAIKAGFDELPEGCEPFVTARHDEAEVDGRTMIETLNGIPGARESTAQGRAQFVRGEGVPLDEL